MSLFQDGPVNDKIVFFVSHATNSTESKSKCLLNRSVSHHVSLIHFSVDRREDLKKVALWKIHAPREYYLEHVVPFQPFVFYLFHFSWILWHRKIFFQRSWQTFALKILRKFSNDKHAIFSIAGNVSFLGEWFQIAEKRNFTKRTGQSGKVARILTRCWRDCMANNRKRKGAR